MKIIEEGAARPERIHGSGRDPPALARARRSFCWADCSSGTRSTPTPFKRRLKKNLPDARVAMSEQSPELGAAWLAAEMEEKPSCLGRDARRRNARTLAGR